jgi:hypothetical protein
MRDWPFQLTYEPVAEMRPAVFRIDKSDHLRAIGIMPFGFSPLLHLDPRVVLAALAAMPLHAQLVSYDGFEDYAAGVQVENGSIGSAGTGLDGGTGWGGSYDVNDSIKNFVRIENRSSSPVNYANGGISISGGVRALRFYDTANGSYALQRPLGITFNAASGDTLWFSVLFRTAGGSPLSNQDFFLIGFDDNEQAAAGNPRVSIGANTTQSSFPSPFGFFVRSTTTVSNSVFYDGLSIAAATTYLLVARIQANAGEYDTVSLFVNPSTLDHPGPPSAEIVLPSGLSALSHAFIRTNRLDSGDAYVLDEWHIGRDYGSVVQALQGALRMQATNLPESPLVLRWPVSPAATVLETSTTLAPESWTEVNQPASLNGAEWEFPVSIEPNTPTRFFRLKR